MPTLNKVMLIGRMTENPGVAKPLSNGSQLLTFNLAVGKGRKNPKTGQWENDPNPLYITCKHFFKQGERESLRQTLESCGKGTLVYIEGSLNYEVWLDNSGNRKSKHTITIRDLQILDMKPADVNDETPAPAAVTSDDSDQEADF